MTDVPFRERDDNAINLPKPVVAMPTQRPQRAQSPGATALVEHLPFHVTEYADEIVEHLLTRERTLHRDADYLARQPDVTERMRIILVDWLVDVHLKFKLHPETFYLAVDYVDRYLMVAPGSRTALQLVGVCAMLLAAKHEEIFPPEVRECIYISANTYSRDEILSMEREIASALNFRLCVPTPYPFMTRVLDCTHATEDVRHLAAYCLDIAALDYRCLRYRPSRVAFAAVLVANVAVENTRRQSNTSTPVAAPLTADHPDFATVWTSAHAYYAHTFADDMAEVIECGRGIVECAAAVNAPTSRYHAVRRKFSNERFGDVSTRYPLPATL